MGDSSVSSAPPPIRLSRFEKRYGQRVAVQSLSFVLGRGEIFGLIGPDGAGKSSVMKAAAGVLAFEGGTVEILGVRVDSERAAEQIKDRIGFMPQGLGLNLYPNLSVEENIDFFARLRGVPAGELAVRKRKLLEMTRLGPFRRRAMKQLSGGMKQKLGLVCTLIHDPELIILDEPTTGVDPVSRRDFWAILGELLHEREAAALISTAYLDEASRFHRVALLHEGREIASGDPRTLDALAPGALVLVQAVDGAAQLHALEYLRPRFEQVDVVGPTVRVFVEGLGGAAAEAQVRSILDGIGLDDVRATEPELEDVLIALLRKEGLSTSGSVRVPHGGSARTSGSIAIEANGLTRDFDGFRAVDQVTFEVCRGEIFGLLGANGAGKTTVIKMLTGILGASSGSGQVAGVDVRHAGSAVKHRIGYMSQAFSLYADLSVSENIELYAGIYGLSRAETRERLGWIVEMGGLRGHLDTPSGRLPMGLRQRLALGCALVHQPEVVFLDEPTSGVDPVGRRRFWDILHGLSRENSVAILVTTHYMNEAEHCDRLALMFGGRIVADAPPSQLKADVERDAGVLLELEVDRPEDAVKALTERGFSGAALFGRRVHLFARAMERDATRARRVLSDAGVNVRGVGPRTLSMEDVFVYRVTALEQQAQAAGQ